MTSFFSDATALHRSDAAPAPQPPLPQSLREALVALRTRAATSGYETAVRLHSYELAPRFLAPSLAATLDRSAPEARVLLRLLQLEETVPRSELEPVLGAPLIAELLAAGILLPRPNESIAAHFRLDVAGDDLLLTENYVRRPLGVYFAEDSQFLRAMIRARAGDRALDLCTGTGVQGLRLARDAASVDLVDLNPAAVRAARLNAALGGVDARVSVWEGDLWSALPADRSWDCVVSNPPLMPVADDVSYPLCGHGGPDGLRIVQRIVEALPARLRPGGRCSVIGACTGRPDRSDIETLVRDALPAGFRSAVYLLSRRPLNDWVASIARTAEIYYPELTYAKAVLRSRRAYASAAPDAVVFTYLLESERDGESPSQLRVVDYSERNTKSYWFVNRGTLTQ